MIDEKKTKKNVKKFFENDFSLLVLSAGFSLTGGTYPVLTTNLRDYDKIADSYKQEKSAERVRILKKVVIAMNASKRTKAILFGLYVEKKRNYDLFIRVGVKQSQYYMLKDKAFLEFADNIRDLIDFYDYVGN